MTENVKAGPTTAISQEQIVTPSVSTALASVPTYATWAILKSRSQGVYLRLTGGTATSADMAITADVPVEITSKLADVRVLQQAANATVDVWYFA